MRDLLTQGDKYKAIHNLIFNELGMTKEDIYKHIDETIESLAKQKVHEWFDNRGIEKLVMDIVDPRPYKYDTIRSDITAKVSKQLVEHLKNRINLSVTVK